MATLTKLTIPPDQPGYSVKDGKETLRSQLDGGAGRYRKDVLNSSSAVAVRWSATREQFLYLRAFYNSVSKSGSIPFLIDLYIDNSYELTEHEVYFIPGSFGLTAHSGLQFTVGAQLEVKPIVANEAYDQSLVMLYNAYGSFEEASRVLDQIAILVNDQMPEALPV